MFKKLHIKIAGFVAVLLILTVIVLQLSTTFILKSMLQEEAEHSTSSLLNSIKGNIELQLKNYEIALNRMSDGQMSQSFLENDEDKTLVKLVNNELEQIKEKNEFVNFAYIGTDKKETLIYPETTFDKDFDPTTRPWYTLAEKTPDQVVWTEPYEDVVSGEMMIAGAKAIVVNNKVKAVIGFDISLNSLNKIIENQKMPYDGYAFIIDQNGTMLAHPSKQGEDMSQDKTYKDIPSAKDGIKIGKDNVIAYQTIDGTGWKVGTQFQTDKLLWVAQEMNKIVMIVSVIALAVAIILSYFLAKTITGPIKQLIGKTKSVSEGDLTVQTAAKSKDEVGTLTKDFNKMVEHMKEMILKVRASSGKVAETTDQLRTVSGETVSTSDEIAKAIEEVATGATEQAAEVDTVNEKSERLSVKMKGIENHADSIQKLSRTSEEASYKGIDALGQLLAKSNEANTETKKVEHMLQQLEDKTKNIEDVVTAISAISDQTNLLALNASIEAARAGESGRGFAVVAEEVRKLAEQSAASSQHISETVKQIQLETKEAVSAMTEASKMNEEQNDMIHETGEALSKITAEMQNLVKSIDHIYVEISDMSGEQQRMTDSIQSISAISQQSAAAAEEVSASTNEQLTALETIATSTEALSSANKDLLDAINKFNV
ncbi:methyl-accepting chemotaxis protein [Bacillus swezeyi]|uniref:Chemotaxis protein n=3 Tax=Bacillus swezeyi TaxID=1925020 RepID=A0A1R1RN96_9BACI|nr:methyl-accepting chemotaxis protein [Bacillus swezeyi]MEC1262347.1 methyl-accepting chemotaxis protein [Bacillus swezeyi]MED2926944.1 methyl-accepting chemotaxis protein [Bacillus swezeyi]MED2965494.1 methyl-accepting chemotaxis protein [Bacillus swezeyi]MED3071103.1 methyl-accepting chemotaxis protein [Bacillus swezeyi]MED3083188.1 methyl-accepting chemotaxis protein [Bacillus swezeyi]